MFDRLNKTKTSSPFNSRQRTVENPCACQGVGVHSGDVITLALKPAPENTGIVFNRIDLEDETKAIVPALLQNIVDTKMCTTVANQYGVTVSTIEHLMAALYACEIDNVIVEVNSAEIPVMDGSAQPFIDIIEEVGIQDQDAPRSFIRVLDTIQVSNDHGRGLLRPSSNPLYKATVDFKGRADFGNQVFSYNGIPETFKDDISEARTFGFLEDAEKIWAMGMAKGSSLDNTVVIDDNKVVNEEGLRFKTEFARHKILDTVGDFYTAGAPILAEFEGYNCGHTMNNLLLKALFSDCKNWELVTPHFHGSQKEFKPFRPKPAMAGFQPAI